MLWCSGLSTVVVFNHDVLSRVKSCWDKNVYRLEGLHLSNKGFKKYILYFNGLEEGLVCILSPIVLCAENLKLARNGEVFLQFKVKGAKVEQDTDRLSLPFQFHCCEDLFCTRLAFWLFASSMEWM